MIGPGVIADIGQLGEEKGEYIPQRLVAVPEVTSGEPQAPGDTPETVPPHSFTFRRTVQRYPDLNCLLESPLLKSLLKTALGTAGFFPL